MKYILLSLLAISVIFGAFHLYSTSSPAEVNPTIVQEETLNSRPFFKKFIKKELNKLQGSQFDIYPEIITYGINMSMNVEQNQRSDDITEASQNMKVTAQCDVQTIYDEETNVFDIAVSYTMVDKHNTDKLSQEQNQADNQDVFEETDDSMYIKSTLEQRTKVIEVVQQQNQFFLLKVNADSGAVLSLQIESAYEEDQTVTYITEQLINDIFPELRKESFKKGNVESDNLGTLKVDYTQEKIDDQHIAITREYDQESYVSTQVDLELPQADYERTVILQKDTGLVVEGQTEYNFALGDTNEEKLQQSDSEEANLEIEVLGKITGQMKSSFWKVEKSDRDAKIAKEMYKYRNAATFQPKKLSKDIKAEIKLGNGEEVNFELVDMLEEDKVVIVDQNSAIAQSTTNTIIKDIVDFDENIPKPFLQAQQEQKLQAAQTFIETKQLAGTSVLGKTIGVDFVYSGTTETSTVALKVKVGSSYIATIAEKSFNNCKASEKQNNTTKSIVFFQATYPVLGIVTIPISAQGKFTYGWNTSVVTQTRFCQFNLQPYFQASFYADGKVSLLGVISAGVYAQGNFLETTLTLSATTKQGSSSIALTGTFHAFTFEFGITYDKISCSLSNILREGQQVQEVKQQPKLKGFFKKIFKAVSTVTKVVSAVSNVVGTVVKAVVNATQICKVTPGFIQIAKTSSAATSYTIWNKSVPFGI